MRGILLDIEGTTTPIQFVYSVLFPFARAELGNFLRQNFDSPELASDVAVLRREHAQDRASGLNPPIWDEGSLATKLASIESYIYWLMDLDRKSTGLKAVQGRIWQHGYDSGALKSQVFADVPAALQSWNAKGIDARIFSSGSILAQKLLFANTEYGDLTPYLNGYFDTTTGAKNAPASYRRIANEFSLPASDVLFVSDMATELDAARSAGLQTLLCLRPGNSPHENIQGHGVIASMREIIF